MFDFAETGLFDPAPFDPLSYWAHLAIGSIALLAALVALSTGKGGRWHKRAGWLFMGGVAVAATTAIIFSFTRFAPPAILSALVAFYAITTSWLAIRRRDAGVKRLEMALSALLLITTLLFLIATSRALALGIATLPGAFSLIVIPLALLAGDGWYFTHYDQRPRVRLFRHVSRMAWTLVIAVRAPLFELTDDLSLNRDLVVMLPLLIAPLVLLLFGRRAMRMAAR